MKTFAYLPVVQQDIKEQNALEEKRRMEQMPKGSVLRQLVWATQRARWKTNNVKRIKQNTKDWRFKAMRKQIYDEKKE